MSDSISRVPPIVPTVPVKPVKPPPDGRQPRDEESHPSERDVDDDAKRAPDRERGSDDDERPSNTELTIDEYV